MWRWFDKSTAFERALLVSRGDDADALEREIRCVLRDLRLRRAIAPWIAPFIAAKRFVLLICREFSDKGRELHGKYWKSSAQVDGGADPVAGTSPGPGYFTSATVNPAPISSHAGGFTIPKAWTTASPAVAGESITHAGIGAGEITAYRAWLLRDGLLFSVYQSQFCWLPGIPVEGDPAAAEQGIHGFKSIFDMVDYGSPGGPFLVSGTVHLWGEVVEHERGWRAQFASVASIDDSSYYDAELLRQIYGVGKYAPKRKAKGKKRG